MKVQGKVCSFPFSTRLSSDAKSKYPAPKVRNPASGSDTWMNKNTKQHWAFLSQEPKGTYIKAS